MAMSLHTKRVVVFFLGLLLCVALILVADQERRRHTPEGRPAPIITAENAACVDCHGRNELVEGKANTVGAVAQWKDSVHAAKGVGCMDCHRGYDEVTEETEGGLKEVKQVPHPDSWRHEGVLISNIVTPDDCRSCHPQQTVENMASRHSSAAMFIGSLDNVLGEFVTGGPNAVLGCKQCHGSRVKLTKTFTDGSTFTLDMDAISREAQAHVEDELGLERETQPVRFKKAFSAEMAKRVQAAFEPHADKMPKDGRAGLSIDKDTWPNSGMGRINPDGSLGSCNACHSRHLFAKALARQPENCGKCHMGPDHPQIEIYEESKHGIAYHNRLADMNLDGDPNTGEWVVGVHYNAAPTCATCHMSAAPGVPRSHDPGLRISWTLRPDISKPTTSISATIEKGQEVIQVHDWQTKRARMQRVCAVCHGPTHIQNFYKQYDALVTLYNEKFAKPAKDLMDYLMTHKDAEGNFYIDRNNPLAKELGFVYFELWHHEGRRMRMGASMMGPDYTHWHGSYEVAKHFYLKYLPKIEELARANNDVALLKKIEELKDQPPHRWIEGLPEDVRQEYQEFYKDRYQSPVPGTEGT